MNVPDVGQAGVMMCMQAVLMLCEEYSYTEWLQEVRRECGGTERPALINYHTITTVRFEDGLRDCPV